LFEQYPNEISCVISEPEKSNIHAPTYNQDLLKLCHDHGALYIMDEMITGFKTDFPGAMKKFNVVPDLATWGKSIANGFAFCALTGKKEVMELGGIRNKGGEKVFLISSTHGGDTTAIAAALATIHEFKTKDVIRKNHQIGNLFSRRVSEVIQKSGLEKQVVFNRSEWLPLFSFMNAKGEPSAELRTLTLQEMIKRGVLFQGTFVPCFSHTSEDVDHFAEALSETLRIYSNALVQGPNSFIVGDTVKPVFRKIL
jgi:glutamate-1-semialdehyde aminotransferase